MALVQYGPVIAKTPFNLGGSKITLTNQDAIDVLNFVQGGGALTPAQSIVNDLGYGAELHRAARIQDAIASPSGYIKKRTEALSTYAQEAVDEFQADMVKLLAIGVKKDDAEKIAHAHTKAKSDLKLTYLNADYPTSILEEALKSQSTALAVTGAGYIKP